MDDLTPAQQLALRLIGEDWTWCGLQAGGGLAYRKLVLRRRMRKPGRQHDSFQCRLTDAGKKAKAELIANGPKYRTRALLDCWGYLAVPLLTQVQRLTNKGQTSMALIAISQALETAAAAVSAAKEQG